MSQQRAAESVGLPIRPFLYTLDQISTLLSVPIPTLKRSYLFYVGRSVGIPPRNQMQAQNIAADGEKPEWRVAEGELIRWLRRMGFRVYDRSWH